MPDELLLSIFTLLARRDLCAVARTSKRCNEIAIPIIYHTIELVDKHTNHGSCETEDPHDDTPIIAILLSLAGNPRLGSYVRKLTHRCHEPPPGPMEKLRGHSFQGPLHAHSLEVLKLAHIAISHMTDVHTIYIIFGHFSLVRCLLRGFFHVDRKDATPIKRLWIESSCLESINAIEPDLSFQGLESLRLVRLRLLTEEVAVELFNKEYEDYLDTPIFEISVRDGINSSQYWKGSFYSSELWGVSLEHWRRISEARFPNLNQLSRQYNGDNPDIYCEPVFADLQKPSTLINLMIQTSAASLTSLSLDWLIGLPTEFSRLFEPMPIFPNLKAFQMRNAVLKNTCFPAGVFLLQATSPFCRFLQIHRKLRCLSWQMHHFFPGDSSFDLEKEPGVREVITHLSRTLTTLRVDYDFNIGEEDSTADDSYWPTDMTRSRRRFVQNFAAQMRTLEVIKLEGKIPKDEVRETIRALQRNPLKKIVLIGRTWPNGFCHGHDAPIPPTDVAMNSVLPPPAHESCEPRYGASILPMGVAINSVLPLPAHESYVPRYGAIGPIMIDIISEYYSETINEIKFCGYRGAPDLTRERVNADAVPYLRSLSKMPNLLHFITAMNINWTRSEYRIRDLIDYWESARPFADSAESTVLSPELKATWHPRALADRIYNVVGIHLSQKRKQSTRVCALLNLQNTRYSNNPIYIMEIWVTPNGKIDRWTVPYPDTHPTVQKRKLMERQWF